MSYLFDQKQAIADLQTFFSSSKTDLQAFGSRVNQTFEAYVFAKTIQYYQTRGWKTSIVNPKGSKSLRLKFSTRGAPAGFSYCSAKKGAVVIQVRHQLRVDIARKYKTQLKPCNVCCDVVVMRNVDIAHYRTNDALPNDQLISFGEVKHMSAFAELIGGFVGLVHELSPERLRRIRTKHHKKGNHIAPYLYVSGIMYSTAQGICESIRRRRYDIDFYSFEEPLS